MLPICGVQLPASTEPPLGVQSNAAAALAPSGSAERPLVSSAGRRGPSVRVILYECLITAARGYPTNVEPLARSTAPGLDVSSLGSELAACERAGGRRRGVGGRFGSAPEAAECAARFATPTAITPTAITDGSYAAAVAAASYGHCSACRGGAPGAG